MPARSPDRPWWQSPRAWRREILSGMVVSVALIPEAIAFSVVAHVDPRVGLFAAVTMALTISIVGGRPGMISGAAGSTALVMASLSEHHGIHYFIAGVLLAGALQVVLGLLGVARLMRYVPRAVSVGFVNALGILLFTSQLPNLEHVPFLVYPMVVLGLLVMFAFGRINRTIPPPLVAIVVLTAITILGHVHVPTVGDKGAVSDTLPGLGLPGVPFTTHTLSIIALPAVAMALVGLLETQMTAHLVDDLTDTGSDKDRESWGQGIANLVTGLFGGMGGCAMIGQTMINIRTGGRTRVSTFVAGAFLLALIVGLHGIVARIPMAALVAVMCVVSFATFDWGSLKPSHLKRMPRNETVVMVLVVALTVATDDLAIGVVCGVVLSALLFARRVQRVAQVHRVQDAPDHARYTVSGELFFASSSDLPDHFDYLGDPDHVLIDLSDSHIWDASTVAALDRVAAKYGTHGKTVELVGMNAASAALHGSLAGSLLPATQPG